MKGAPEDAASLFRDDYMTGIELYVRAEIFVTLEHLLSLTMNTIKEES